jgi:myo-inositol-1(or 4)-monophosphatase
MTAISHTEALSRIQEALDAARTIFARFTPGDVQAEYKAGHDPVTQADTQVDAALRKCLLRPGEGWLSEESIDDPIRLESKWVWIVDPLDGTREFVQGIPEWCCSIGLVQEGKAFAGGICNPATQESFVGTVESGLLFNGKTAKPSVRTSLAGGIVLASRSEVKRGEWEQFQGKFFEVRPTGSVAYKLACVAAGLADATWTLTPKHEWDVAAGVALIESAGGFAGTLDQSPLLFNNRKPKLTGLLAGGAALKDEIITLTTAALRSAPTKPQPLR